jgi:hypothetical protein
MKKTMKLIYYVNCAHKSVFEYPPPRINNGFNRVTQKRKNQNITAHSDKGEEELYRFIERYKRF